MAIKTGAAMLEDTDFSALLAALGGAPSAPRLRLAHLSLQGVEIVAPDRTGAGEHHIAFESFEVKNDYEGDIIKQGSTTLKGLVVEAAPGSEFGDFLASLGYLRLEVDAVMNAHYDAAAKTFSVDQLSIEGAQMGSIAAKADFANVDPVLFKGDDKMTPQALLAAGIASAEVRMVNAGVVERALAFFAKERKMTPAALRLEAAAAVIHEAPTLLGPSADALNVAIEAQKFIALPKTFVATARSKGAPLKWSDVMSAGDPRDLLTRVDITAVADR
jgi:hypothetical protein